MYLSARGFGQNQTRINELIYELINELIYSPINRGPPNDAVHQPLLTNDRSESSFFNQSIINLIDELINLLIDSPIHSSIYSLIVSRPRVRLFAPLLDGLEYCGGICELKAVLVQAEPRGNELALLLCKPVQQNFAKTPHKLPNNPKRLGPVNQNSRKTSTKTDFSQSPNISKGHLGPNLRSHSILAKNRLEMVFFLTSRLGLEFRQIPTQLPS